MRYHDDIEYALSTFNTKRRLSSLDENAISKLSDGIPPSLLEFISSESRTEFHDGLFRMCNPLEFQPILALIFRSDRDLRHDECRVIGYTAFGDLYVWSNRIFRVRIALAEGLVFSTRLVNPGMPAPQSIDGFAAGMIPDRENADFEDVDGLPLYNRCQAMHGPLEDDECYGFFPALALSGIAGPSRVVENIRRVKALEHFSILAQLTMFNLAAPRGGEIILYRPIG